MQEPKTYTYRMPGLQAVVATQGCTVKMEGHTYVVTPLPNGLPMKRTATYKMPEAPLCD